MLRVGLTGGIGAGKSTVTALLAERGAVIVDSDVLAREVIAPGTPGIGAVSDVFGADVLGADGGLDRAAMARLVFADPEARRRLEGIIHPLVRAEAERRFATAPSDAIVVNDVPLLAEVGLAPTFDLVIVVAADQPTRVARLAGRGMNAEDAAARIAAQAPDAVRDAVADAIIDNSGGPVELETAVERLWMERLLPFEHNKRHRTPVKRPEELALVEYQPTWAAAYRRIEARLLRVLDDRAVRIDHIGSTSVPGLLGKDVIDVQVILSEASDLLDVAEPLADNGFPLSSDTADTPFPADDDPARWRKRLHGGTDPGQICHIHLRPAASPAARLSLLFRDWLRTDAAVRKRYADAKRRLAAEAPNASAYAAAKEPIVSEMLPAAEHWAATSGWG